MTVGASSCRDRPSTVTSREYLARNLAFPSDVVKYADVGDSGLTASTESGVTGVEGIDSCLQQDPPRLPNRSLRRGDTASS